MNAEPLDLVMIDSLRHFEEIVERIAEIIEGRGADELPDAEINIKVPSGPIEHW